MEQAHYEKIRISDAIYVVDIQGYIGSAVSEEIRFCQRLGEGDSFTFRVLKKPKRYRERQHIFLHGFIRGVLLMKIS